MKAYMIDREDVRQAMQVIINVTKEVKKGRNYLIFAEGTRSKNGNHVGTFKGGSFKSATKAQCPIVPVALVDSFKPFDTNTIVLLCRCISSNRYIMKSIKIRRLRKLLRSSEENTAGNRC